MPSEFRRRDAKGKPTGKWIAQWKDHLGKTRTEAIGYDRQAARDIARKRESEAASIRAGTIDPGQRVRLEASMRPISEHLDDFRLGIISRGSGPEHARRVRSAVSKLLADASIVSIGDIPADRIQAAIGRLKVAKSARSANMARWALKNFLIFLVDSGRLDRIPPGIMKIKGYNVKLDRKYVRRAITEADLDRLFDAAEQGGKVSVRWNPAKQPGRISSPGGITGPERSALYRVASITGFRANELRHLGHECFCLDGDDPQIFLDGSKTKGKRDANQRIRVRDVEWLRAWLATRAGKTPLVVPENTAKILQADLLAIGIPKLDAKGRVIDFHGLRVSYSSILWKKGMDPKLIQKSMRHATLAQTMDTYVQAEDEDLRDALERT